MDEQQKSLNTAGSGEMPGGVRPEQAPGVTVPEAPAAAEAAPAPGASPGSAGPAAAGTAQPVLTRDDAGVAVAAMPGSPVPGGVVPTPTVAGDVDVIEPEWVDRAEEVVKQHTGDPYGEEEAIEDLQQDYLQKRYGYTVADPNGDKSKPENA